MKLKIVLISALFLFLMNCIHFRTFFNSDKAHRASFADYYTFTSFSRDSSTCRKGYYHKGTLDSLVSIGSNNEKSIFRFSDGLPNGLCETWHSNGMKASTVEYTKGDKLIYSRAEYDSTGNDLFEWKNDPHKNNAIYKSWYASKARKNHIEFHAGLRDGKYVQYNINGRPFIDFTYSSGKPVLTQCHIFDNDQNNALEIIQEKLLEAMPAYNGVYTRYLKKNGGIEGNARLLLTLDAENQNLSSILLSSDFNCREFMNTMNSIVSRQTYDTLNFKGNSGLIIILPVRFAGWKK